MRRPLVVGAIAAGALGIGLITGPVLANAVSGDPTTPTYGRGAGYGANAGGTGMGGHMVNGGAGPQNRTTTIDPTDRPCLDTAVNPSGTLTDAQKTSLAAIAEDEKLAHDTYVVLAESTGDVRFTRIVAAETQHLSMVRALLDRYDIADPTEGKGDGQFATPAVQKLYGDLVAEGRTSTAAALAVGQKIEKLDIADLEKAGAGLDAPDVEALYANFKTSSERHLAAFSR